MRTWILIVLILIPLASVTVSAEPRNNCKRETGGEARCGLAEGESGYFPDADQDGYGNCCDTDYDNDAITGGVDQATFNSNWLSNDINEVDSDVVAPVGGTDYATFSASFLDAPGPSDAPDLCGDPLGDVDDRPCPQRAFQHYRPPTVPSTGINYLGGAEGFGAQAIGAREDLDNAKVYVVDTLSGATTTSGCDSGDCSLRDALETHTDDPRYILFNVSGVIELEEPLKPEAPVSGTDHHCNFTLAGQSAPGGGIEIRLDPDDATHANDSEVSSLLILDGCPSGSSTVIRFIRFRPGFYDDYAAGQSPLPAVQINADNVILDHVSCSWGLGGNCSIYADDVDNVTIQWSMIYEDLDCRDDAFCGEELMHIGPPGGSASTNISLIHNLLATSGIGPIIRAKGPVEIINNYTMAGKTAYFIAADAPASPGLKIDLVNNVQRDGEMSGYRSLLSCFGPTPPGSANDYSVYDTGNSTESTAPILDDTEPACAELVAPSPDVPHTDDSSGFDDPVWVVTEYATSILDDLVTKEAGDRYYVDCDGNFVRRTDTNCTDGGAVPCIENTNFPMAVTADGADERLADYVVAEEEAYPDLGNALVSDPSEVGGFDDEIRTATVCDDDDGDGIPDDFEQAHTGMDYQDATDFNEDHDNDGWPNIEEWLDGTKGTEL